MPLHGDWGGGGRGRLGPHRGCCSSSVAGRGARSQCSQPEAAQTSNPQMSNRDQSPPEVTCGVSEGRAGQVWRSRSPRGPGSWSLGLRLRALQTPPTWAERGQFPGLGSWGGRPSEAADVSGNWGFLQPLLQGGPGVRAAAALGAPTGMDPRSLPRAAPGPARTPGCSERLACH